MYHVILFMHELFWFRWYRIMEFACSYDEGKLASESQSPTDSAQGMVRAKDEIDGSKFPGSFVGVLDGQKIRPVLRRKIVCRNS